MLICIPNFYTALVVWSTTAVLCDFTENMLSVRLHIWFAMLCICRELHGDSLLWNKAWRR